MDGRRGGGVCVYMYVSGVRKMLHINASSLQLFYSLMLLQQAELMLMAKQTYSMSLTVCKMRCCVSSAYIHTGIGLIFTNIRPAGVDINWLKFYTNILAVTRHKWDIKLSSQIYVFNKFREPINSNPGHSALLCDKATMNVSGNNS